MVDINIARVTARTGEHDMSISFKAPPAARAKHDAGCAMTNGHAEKETGPIRRDVRNARHREQIGRTTGSPRPMDR